MITRLTLAIGALLTLTGVVAYAATHARAQDLASALVKLYEDNAATLTPDPLYVDFYYSHPPAAQRIQALGRLAAPGP